MTFKPLSQLNWFFKLAPEKTLCGIDQLVYLHLFNKFNQSHWTETISVGDAELLELIRWYDKTGNLTIMNLIRTAKTVGLSKICYKRSHRKVVRKLIPISKLLSEIFKRVEFVDSIG